MIFLRMPSNELIPSIFRRTAMTQFRNPNDDFVSRQPDRFSMTSWAAGIGHFMKQIPIPAQPAYRVILTAALFTMLTGNQAFFEGVNAVYPWAGGNALFTASLAIVLVALTVLLIAPIAMLLTMRVTTCLFLVIAAIAGHFADTLGVVIDPSMLVNAVETDSGEVQDLLGVGLLTRLLLLGVIPSVVIWLIPVRPTTTPVRLYQSALTAVASVVVVAVCIGAFSPAYASFFREHKPLRHYANPVFPVYSMGKFIADALDAGTTAHAEFQAFGTDARVSEDHEGRELIVMVVGETARRDRFSLNGYGRETNPRLAAEASLVSYTKVTACGTSTAISVPCMFSMLDRVAFDRGEASHQENVLDVLTRSGVTVLWRDNNSGSKGVADRVLFEDFTSPDINPLCDPECRDIGMLEGLQEYVDSQDGDILIVLHQMGNHGPAYYKRYPEEFERFSPACHSIELSACSLEEINNAYDNAILYTDYFLAEVIAFLKDNTPAYETAMLYVSDHGESLGENGMYLHGAPYMFAPIEQTEVAVIAWLGSSSDVKLESAFDLRDTVTSHDAVSGALVKLFEVESTQLVIGDGLFSVSTDAG
jgi:lipid A ethanolaminephosphotransferase